MNEKYLKYKKKYLMLKGGMSLVSYWFPKFKTDDYIYFIDIVSKKSHRGTIKTVKLDKLYDIFHGGKIYKNIPEDYITTEDNNYFQLKVWFYSEHKTGNEIDYSVYTNLLRYNNQNILNSFLLEHNIKTIISKYYEIDITELQNDKSLLNIFELPPPFERHTIEMPSLSLSSRPNICRNLVKYKLKQFGKNVEYIKNSVTTVSESSTTIQQRELINITLNQYEDIFNTINTYNPKIQFTKEQLNECLRKYNVIINICNIVNIWLKSVNNQPKKDDYDEFIKEMEERGLQKLTKDQIDICINLLGVTI